MAGPAAPEPEPRFGWKATVFALVFSGLVLGGAGLATVVSAPDDHDKVDVEGKTDGGAGDHDDGEEHGDE